jgi:predicted phosphodiesterase
MKRTVNKKADLILGADFHIREDIPSCRTDDFLPTLMGKLWWLKRLQKEHECPVLHAGDLFHHWKPSPYLLSLTMSMLPEQFYTIYGQHDLPQHNWQKREYSGIHTLEMAKKLIVLPGVHWGQKPEDLSFPIKGRKILVWHKMVWQGVKLWPDQTDPSAMAILRKYPEYDLILTGDNHKPFVEEYEGRLLVNPGSLTRQTAAQMDHKPRVYLYFADNNSISPAFLPIEDAVVRRDHIDQREERDERLEAYISRLNTDWTVDLSFERNLGEFFRANDIGQDVQKLVYKAIEHE